MLTNLQIVLLSVLLPIFLLIYFIYFRPGQGVKNVPLSYSYDFALPKAILAKGKKILIFAPHPDDEALMCAGIITHALTNGAHAKIAVLTNGDKKGRKIGLTRIRETIKAMESLGLHQEDIFFFGYGSTTMDSNSWMNRLWDAETDGTIVSSKVGTQTYSVPEAPEYHLQKHGVHASYNRLALRQDLEAVIEECNPDHIFASTLYDAHPEHAILYQFIVAAIIGVKRNKPSFSPVLHEYLIHAPDGDDCWPIRNRKNAPLSPFSKPASWDAATILNWDTREIFTVPVDMQRLPLKKNKKHIAISTYRSQRPAANKNYLYSYVKQDEIFWEKDFSNIAVLASVSVSSENVATGQLGCKAIDGITDGYPRFPGNEWVTMGETAGAWITLSWPQAYTVQSIILYDRPNLDDNITGATLHFSDGSEIKLELLPANGSAYEVSFAPKTIDWVQLTVDSAQGANIGLSEFEVYPVTQQL